MTRRHGVRVAISAIVLGLLAPAAATAGEYCVAPATGCANGQRATLQLALDAAAATAVPDTVRMPAGTVQGPGEYDTVNPDNTLTLIGAGRDATTVTANVNNKPILDIRRGAQVSDFTIRAPDPAPLNQYGTSISAMPAARIRVISATVNPTGTTFNGVARDILANGPGYVLINGSLEDAVIDGGGLSTNTSSVTLNRVRVTAPAPLSGQNSKLTVTNSLFVQTDPTGPVVLHQPSPVPNGTGYVTLSNVTIIGAGGSCTGVLSSGYTSYSAPNDFTSENVTVVNSIIRGCPTTLKRNPEGGNRSANLTVVQSAANLAPGAIVSTGAGTLDVGAGNGNIDVNPNFPLGGLYFLPFGSPVIDKGLVSTFTGTSAGETTDLAGNPRIADGDGDGAAVRDLGAYEYQRSAPAVTANANRLTAGVGEPIEFTSAATESDPGEIVAGYRWEFDDGATVAGNIATHAFTTPGTHTATALATDSVGVTGSKALAVTVTASLPAPPAAGTVTKLSLSPTSFRAASKGASAAATKKKKRPPIGTKVTTTLSAPAVVTYTVERKTTGRRSGTSCVARTAKNRRAKACTRYVKVSGSFTRAAGAAKTFTFSGRLSGKKLSAASYRLVAKAGVSSKTATFRIVR